MADTINTYSLGSIQSIDSDVGSDLTVMAFPMSGTGGVIALDYSGVTRKFTITGELVADTQAALMTLIAQIDLLQNGNQGTVVLHLQMFQDAAVAEYYPDGNFNVKVMHFAYHWSQGDIGNTAEYILDVVEST